MADKDEIIVQPHEIQGFEETQDNIQLLKNTLSSGGTNLTDGELKLFLYQVKRTALDPLARQIYVMKDRSGKLSFITSIDGYRLVAERSGKYLGQTKTEWEFDSEGKLLSATVGVVKKIGNDKDTTYATAWFDEYAKDVDKYYSMWKKMPKTMIAKVAESLALRKAFPQELGGVYTEDEMQQAHETADYKITPVTEPITGETHGTITKVPYNRDDFQPEASRDINEDVIEELITDDVLLKLGGEVKKKGIADMRKVNVILDELAKTKGVTSAHNLTVTQARELFVQIKNETKEALDLLTENE